MYAKEADMTGVIEAQNIIVIRPPAKVYVVGENKQTKQKGISDYGRLMLYDRAEHGRV